MRPPVFTRCRGRDGVDRSSAQPWNSNHRGGEPAGQLKPKGSITAVSPLLKDLNDESVSGGRSRIIGCHISKRLDAEGNHVVVVDNLSNGSLDKLKEMEGSTSFIFYECDVNNTLKLRRIFDKYAFDMVYHYAANADASKGEEAVKENVNNF